MQSTCARGSREGLRQHIVVLRAGPQVCRRLRSPMCILRFLYLLTSGPIWGTHYLWCLLGHKPRLPNSVVGGGCSVHGKMLSSTPGPQPGDNQSVCPRHCLMSRRGTNPPGNYGLGWAELHGVGPLLTSPLSSSETLPDHQMERVPSGLPFSGPAL